VSTPALDRAAEEVRQQDAAGPLMRTSVPTRTRAHVIVSAALHDPDDPDALAVVVREHTPSGLRCDCGRDLVDAADWARHVADAVRAAVLGPG